MNIINVSGRELEDYEIETIKRFRSYTDGIAFACLREGVCVMIEADSHDVEALTEATFYAMERALNEQPDFYSITTPDGYKMTLLQSGVAAFETIQNNSVGREMFIALRDDALDACEVGEIIAFAFEEQQ